MSYYSNETVLITAGIVAGIGLLSMFIICCVYRQRRANNPSGVVYADNYFQKKRNNSLPLEPALPIETERYLENPQH